MNPFLGLPLVVLLSTSAPAQAPAPTAAPTREPFAVVELFTSEGCSSCPPADRLLSAIAGEAERAHRNVLALAFHVDYWNTPAWRDSFSDAANSERQRNYARALGAELYTPQAVVNGRHSCVGSDAGTLRRAIDAALARAPRAAITLELASEHGQRMVRYRVAGAPASAMVAIAVTESGFRTHVKGGENAGRDLTHDDVVRMFLTRPLGDDPSGDAPIPAASSSHPRRVIVLVQDPNTLEVLGAASERP
jgi:hypothetical protein